MSEHEPSETTAQATDESFLGRWSRLKAEARGCEPRPVAPVDAGGNEPLTSTAADVAQRSGTPPGPSLPDLDQLGEDSDYSAFLAPDVDADLRRSALRKLFHSPKFNVFDGLDTYRDDFTSFPALGDIVTADMRHRLEQAARELLARTGEARSGPAPATDAAPTAPTAPPATRNEDDAEHGAA